MSRLCLALIVVVFILGAVALAMRDPIPPVAVEPPVLTLPAATTLLAPELRELQRKGLKDPIADLRSDLMGRPELIPVPGVLGGRMGFPDPSQIHVLGTKWVAAYFEDGHQAGKLLLEYTVHQGRIEWRVIDWQLL